jgi:hypothetical protein
MACRWRDKYRETTTMAVMAMARKSRTTGLALALIASVVACGHPPANDYIPSLATTQPAPLDLDQIPGQFPAPAELTQAGQTLAPVRGCVNLMGPQRSPSLKGVPCGSADNNYIVVQRVETPDQCVADADQRFYLNGEDGQWTACLDYAWRSETCLSIGTVSAQSVSCDDLNAPNRQRPTRIQAGTTTTAGCPDGGFAHPVRRFTVCTQTE